MSVSIEQLMMCDDTTIRMDNFHRYVTAQKDREYLKRFGRELLDRDYISEDEKAHYSRLISDRIRELEGGKAE